MYLYREQYLVVIYSCIYHKTKNSSTFFGQLNAILGAPSCRYVGLPKGIQFSKLIAPEMRLDGPVGHIFAHLATVELHAIRIQTIAYPRRPLGGAPGSDENR